MTQSARHWVFLEHLFTIDRIEMTKKWPGKANFLNINPYVFGLKLFLTEDNVKSNIGLSSILDTTRNGQNFKQKWIWCKISFIARF